MNKLDDLYKPKYLQLFEIIKSDILSGRIKCGDKLLSENKMKEKYCVSSTTVRKCLDILKRHGLIKRIQGVGTFVSDRLIERSLIKILSFTNNMKQIGLEPSTKVLDKRIIKAKGVYCEKLN